MPEEPTFSFTLKIPDHITLSTLHAAAEYIRGFACIEVDIDKMELRVSYVHLEGGTDFKRGYNLALAIKDIAQEMDAYGWSDFFDIESAMEEAV